MKTLRQVAVAAGVHPATAASVLNAARGNTRVAEPTRRRILTAARKLGYVRNESARRLKAVSHFDERGLRRVGFFAPRRHQESPSVLVRRQIFLEECRRRGLPSPVSATFDGGRELGLP